MWVAWAFQGSSTSSAFTTKLCTIEAEHKSCILNCVQSGKNPFKNLRRGERSCRVYLSQESTSAMIHEQTPGFNYLKIKLQKEKNQDIGGGGGRNLQFQQPF